MIEARIDLYKQIETLRKRPLIAFVTSQRPNLGGSMASDVIDVFIDQIQSLPPEAKSVDLLVESTGGDPLVAMRIISLLRSRVSDIAVLVPHSAYSAATLLALGADEIVMGKYGCLGPIDPQITVRKKDGSTQQFAYEDIVSYLEFSKAEVGLTEQKHIEAAFRMLGETVEPATLGFAKRSSSLSLTIGEKLLQTHMTDPEAKTGARAIATKLNKNFYSHGHALNRDDAKEIGLKITVPSEELEGLMWSIHQDFEAELQTRHPFNPLAEFLLEDAAKPYLSSPPPLSVPPQIPENVVLQIMQGYISSQLVPVPPVERTVKIAFLEGIREAAEFRQGIQILVQRDIRLNFQTNVVSLDGGWHSIEVPKSSSTQRRKGKKRNDHLQS